MFIKNVRAMDGTDVHMSVGSGESMHLAISHQPRAILAGDNAILFQEIDDCRYITHLIKIEDPEIIENFNIGNEIHPHSIKVTVVRNFQRELRFDPIFDGVGLGAVAQGRFVPLENIGGLTNERVEEIIDLINNS